MKTIEDKKAIVAQISEKLKERNHFYVIDIANLNAADTSNLRRKCFEKDITLLVVKNTLLKKALEQKGDFNSLYPTLKGTTSLMLCNTANVPAKLIKEIRGTGKEKPILKAAYVEECIYVGDKSLDSLASLKSRTELIGDVVGLLQSPMKTVLGQLQSGKNIIGGVVKTLQERAQ
jgi:large subunit ribosomal protein L10